MSQLLKKVGAVAFILFPAILIVAFSMHFMGEFSLKDFFDFQFSYTQPSAERFLELFASERLLDFVLPHLIVYLALPLLVPAVVYLGSFLMDKKPVLTIVGVGLTIIGVVFMGGIFGSWMSFVAIGNVTSEQFSEAIPILSLLIKSNAYLGMTGILAGCSLLGFIVIAVGLLTTNTVPRWQSLLVLIGNMMIISFMDLDNLMWIGAALWLVGAFPIAMKTFKEKT